MFRPRMQSSVDGISVVGGVKWRAWDGVIADVWSVNCAEDACGDYVSEDPRLFVVLQMEGPGGLVLQAEADRRRWEHSRALSVSYIPAGYPLRGACRNVSALRHLDLHFDTPTLLRRFGGDLDEHRLSRPRFVFDDDRIAALAPLIAAECQSEDPLHDLYGDGLVSALQAALFGIARRSEKRRGRLSERQLQRVKAYIEAHCLKTIRLSELAELTGLSQSYFSHAFKMTTGVAPHRWQMQARIRKVQRFLLRKETRLTEVAVMAGFSDQAHLTRVFKQHVGLTPAAWLREYAG